MPPETAFPGYRKHLPLKEVATTTSIIFSMFSCKILLVMKLGCQAKKYAGLVLSDGWMVNSCAPIVGKKFQT